MKKTTLLIALLIFLCVKTVGADTHELSQSEQDTLQAKVNVLAEILAFYATKSLDRPKDLADCIEEMMAMRRLGKCADQYSGYLTKEDFERLNEEKTGEFGGIGLELTQKSGVVVVVSPIKGTPAAKAGFLPEDIILEVDDKKVGNSLEEAVHFIKGQAGSEVKIKVFRKDAPEPISFLLKREIIQIHPVEVSEIQSGKQKIAVIKIPEFNDNTPGQFERALADAEKNDEKKVVLDFRNNPGGLLEDVLKMLAFFMRPTDIALAYKTRYTEIPYTAPAVWLVGGRNFGVYRNLDVVILINKGSASASEIFAGAMKDWGYTVIGKKSFCKGVGQRVFPLSDGSALRLTTFEFLVGNSRTSIREDCVTPTIEVENSGEEGKDEQMDKAVEVLLSR